MSLHFRALAFQMTMIKRDRIKRRAERCFHSLMDINTYIVRISPKTVGLASTGEVELRCVDSRVMEKGMRGKSVSRETQ